MVLRKKYLWMYPLPPQPISRVLAPFLEEGKGLDRGLTLKEVINYGTDKKFLPGHRISASYKKTLEHLVKVNVLEFFGTTDRYFIVAGMDLSKRTVA